MQLSVRRLAPRLSGKGLAAISQRDLQQMNLTGRSPIRIRGRERTEALARCVQSRGDEATTGIVALDRLLRSTLGVEVGEVVTIESISTAEATSVTLGISPVDSLPADGTESLTESLQGRPVISGTPIGVNLPQDGVIDSRLTTIQVIDSKPGGPVEITADTEISFNQSDSQSQPHPKDSHPINEGRLAFSEIGGLKTELATVRRVVETPLRSPEVFDWFGIDPPSGILLYGPPGTGKTLLGKVLAAETTSTFLHIVGSEIQSPHPGETEQELRNIFGAARDQAPTIIFIDELDSLVPDRKGRLLSPGDEKNVGQLLGLMDGIQTYEQVVVIGATNRIDAIDPALRRPGRFDYELEIGPPTAPERREILDIHTRDVPLDQSVNLTALAERTHGFVGADLKALVTEAALTAIERTNAIDRLSSRAGGESTWASVRPTDFETALANIAPSALREYSIEKPNVGWDDIGGLSNVKQVLREVVEWPTKYEDAYERLAVTPPSGILLHGPPGTGKTLVAKAVAKETDSNFISIKGPELVNMWVGESAKNVRDLFTAARQNAPAVLFFDEIDSIGMTRQGHTDREGERLLTQLLTEIDGVTPLHGVTVIGSTNRIEVVDKALLRPGRFEYLLKLSLPDIDEREEILNVHTRNRPLAPDVDLAAIAAQTDDVSGAYLESLCREAALCSLRDSLDQQGNVMATDELQIGTRQFDAAQKILQKRRLSGR